MCGRLLAAELAFCSTESFLRHAAAAQRRYHPGPEFKEVKGALAMDMAAIKSGDKELWLLQLPKTVSDAHAQQVSCQRVY